jgi:hypothetical protein
VSDHSSCPVTTTAAQSVSAIVATATNMECTRRKSQGSRRRARGPAVSVMGEADNARGSQPALIWFRSARFFSHSAHRSSTQNSLVLCAKVLNSHDRLREVSGRIFLTTRANAGIPKEEARCDAER